MPDLTAFDSAGLAIEAMIVLGPESTDGSVGVRVQSMGRALQTRPGRSLEGEAIAPEHEETLGASNQRCFSTLALAHG